VEKVGSLQNEIGGSNREMKTVRQNKKEMPEIKEIIKGNKE
jgi:hypothetical protein